MSQPSAAAVAAVVDRRDPGPEIFDLGIEVHQELVDGRCVTEVATQTDGLGRLSAVRGTGPNPRGARADLYLQVVACCEAAPAGPERARRRKAFRKAKGLASSATDPRHGGFRIAGLPEGR